MKRLTLILLALATAMPLVAETVIYEGFHPLGEEAGVRQGFLGTWHRQQGEVGTLPKSVALPSVKGSKGALILEKKGEALAQIGVSVTGTYYGSFRVTSPELKPDSILCLVFAESDLEELTPKTANIAILAKGWRSDHAVILTEGKAAKNGLGAPIENNQSYLVLFKVNDGSKGPRSVTTWILNPVQLHHFAAKSFSEDELNAAPLGTEAGAVMQRVSIDPKPSARLSLMKGDVVACMAKFSPLAVFDEIRISTSSLKEAAGVATK